MPESVRADLLAAGTFESVAAAAEGAPLVFAARAGEGANLGQAWDAAAGAAFGPALPGFCEDWAFGVLPGPDGASPVVAWTHRDRLHVHDLRSGAELALEPGRAVHPDLVGLAVHGGRGAVVAVFGPAHGAEVVVWDARTGHRLGECGVFLGHWSAIERRVLHGVPATGPLIGLTRDTDRAEDAEDGAPGARHVSVLDVERGEEVAALPSEGSPDAAFLHGPGGAVLVQPGRGEVLVRRLDGERVAALETTVSCERVAAASVDGSLLVVADDRDDPCALLAWDTASTAPHRRLEVPAPVNDLALASDGTLVAATDRGLYRCPAAL
ncbi:hypothetical protein [Actinomadura roseirufa]|uniref:hypothetical protein n=1 Tax=Actinomadura roseirufa TaxID=2094049 RepID=UPI0010418C2B|nr:hypothetical protein [Actinomadura roseirufa]